MTDKSVLGCRRTSLYRNVVCAAIQHKAGSMTTCAIHCETSLLLCSARLHQRSREAMLHGTEISMTGFPRRLLKRSKPLNNAQCHAELRKKMRSSLLSKRRALTRSLKKVQHRRPAAETATGARCAKPFVDSSGVCQDARIAPVHLPKETDDAVDRGHPANEREQCHDWL